MWRLVHSAFLLINVIIILALHRSNGNNTHQAETSSHSGPSSNLDVYSFEALSSISLNDCLTTETSQESQVVDVGICILATESICPDNIYVQFYLSTRLNPNEEFRLDLVSDNLGSSNFNPDHPTKIIIHGYWSSRSSIELVNIRNGYLMLGDYNVIAVDWRDLARGPPPCYLYVVLNASHVGKCLAQLVQWLRDAKAEDIHVIGFSMGAHIAGFAANNLRPYLLPRITGLDPALPLKITSNTDLKLDAGDAVFVDVIHTNALFNGKVEKCGHVDFYVNGGSQQPKCRLFEPEFSLCSHSRAKQYFAESVISDVGFWGWECPGLIKYIFGMCRPTTSSTQILMGEHVSHSARGTVMVNTGSASPFALGPLVPMTRILQAEIRPQQYHLIVIPETVFIVLPHTYYEQNLLH